MKGEILIHEVDEENGRHRLRMDAVIGEWTSCANIACFGPYGAVTDFWNKNAGLGEKHLPKVFKIEPVIGVIERAPELADTTRLEKTCVQCGVTSARYIAKSDYDRWKLDPSVAVKDVFQNLSEEDREFFFVTGVCANCSMKHEPA